METPSAYQAQAQNAMSNPTTHSVLPRPIRADAARNRVLILTAALEAFATEGLGFSMDGVAKRAGVGPGTLYRHFPTREALLAASLEEHYAAIRRTQDSIAAEERDAGRALERWILALGIWLSEYEGLPEPLRAAWGGPESALSPTCQVLVDATHSFLAPAQAGGYAKPSLTAKDMFLVALAIAWAAGSSEADAATRAALIETFKSGWTLAPAEHAD